MESDLTTIPAKHGVAIELQKQQLLVVTDPEGGQVCDLVAFRSGDVREWLSNGRSFDYNGTIYLTEGHILYSNASEAMLTIVSDQVGQHDYLVHRMQSGDVPHSIWGNRKSLELSREPHQRPCPYRIGEAPGPYAVQHLSELKGNAKRTT